MKKILALIASQRKLANGEIIAKEVARAADKDCNLELLRLTDLNLQPCRACYVCLNKDKKCSIDDDLYYVIEKMKEADGIIFVSPDYILGPAAVTKLFADRIIAIAQMLDELWGKPCVVVATNGVKGWEGYTLAALNSFVKFMGLDLKDSHIFLGPLPGEGIIKEGALDRAREMGRNLFNEGRKPKNGECPTCLSDIWKFEEPNSAVCAICGQRAKIIGDKEGLKWVYESPSTRFNKKDLQEHFQHWLNYKVQEFIKRREELGQVKNKYKDIGTWAQIKRE